MSERVPSEIREFINTYTRLSTQEKVLAYGMFYGKGDVSVDYSYDAAGRRVNTIGEREFGELIRKFQTEPKEILAMGRQKYIV